MNCLQILPKSWAPALRPPRNHPRGSPGLNLAMTGGADRLGERISANVRVTCSMGSSANEVTGHKSDTYSSNMTQSMGAVFSFGDKHDLALTYRHELGMNYNFIRHDLIVGSCLQNPADVDKLRNVGVKTIFCLQQDSDLEYFNVDIGAIRDYAAKCGDIEHIRAEIRDFDAYNLRMRLPAVVSKLHKAILRNGGITYVHCTAGLGRAPAATLAYMFWILGYGLREGHDLLLSNRPCFPKLEAVKGATSDILTGISKSRVTLTWEDNHSSFVEVAGLDVGWGQRIALDNKEQGKWIVERDLPEGRYEYKYIVNGEWTCNNHELLTSPNGDGHVNNYVDVFDENTSDEDRELRRRLEFDNVVLSEQERLMIIKFLESYRNSKH